MPEIPLTAPHARYLLNLVKIHLGAQAPPESEIIAERDEVGRLTLRRGSTCWSADGDGVAEAEIGGSGPVRKGRWHFGAFSRRPRR